MNRHMFACVVTNLRFLSGQLTIMEELADYSRKNRRGKRVATFTQAHTWPAVMNHSCQNSSSQSGLITKHPLKEEQLYLMLVHTGVGREAEVEVRGEGGGVGGRKGLSCTWL